MIDDIIAEIKLLSAIASHIERAENATPERDVTLLFSRLSLLAEHAQKVKRAEAGESLGFSQHRPGLSQHTRPLEEPQHRLRQRIESGPASPHNWVLEVLEDLTIYTRTNDLHSLADSLENISDGNRDQLSENVQVDPAIDCAGTGTIVAFTLDKRSKVSGEPAP